LINVGAASCTIRARTSIVSGDQIGNGGKINALVFVWSYLIVRNFVGIPQRIVFPEKGQD